MDLQREALARRELVRLIGEMDQCRAQVLALAEKAVAAYRELKAAGAEPGPALKRKFRALLAAFELPDSDPPEQGAASEP